MSTPFSVNSEKAAVNLITQEDSLSKNESKGSKEFWNPKIVCFALGIIFLLGTIVFSCLADKWKDDMTLDSKGNLHHSCTYSWFVGGAVLCTFKSVTFFWVACCVRKKK